MATVPGATVASQPSADAGDPAGLVELAVGSWLGIA
ncbi:flagellar biosynthesis/typeIII secretory [Zymobacter palmae]|uniref:Flagellar biosynthesis/typeIII secretory n=1 Tax=Zymobacter palmae TaxID=33074 RepID=A0A348HEP7_9GAMM|nr:flagellar biosynthesis/typeIII secretory [Zymobacter palmae]